MADRIKRVETTHIDEVKRTSSSAVQWLLEKANIAGTHPISHNNKLTFMIGGEEAFVDIARHIRRAKASIDICCWGFDPGMELERSAGSVWPRGETYGDLLIDAGRRGVKVRLLVWYDSVAVQTENPRNMPGYTHDVLPGYWLTDERIARLSARNCVADALHSARPEWLLWNSSRKVRTARNIGIRAEARRNYCRAWYQAAFAGKLSGIEIRTRNGKADAISKSLESEAHPPSGGMTLGAERQVMVQFGTHHQKPILIDYFHPEAGAAVGYIMGLNSLTEYWDTTAHQFDDPRREHERVVGIKATAKCEHLRPLRDYACRLDGGGGLKAIYENFIRAWNRAGDVTKAGGKSAQQEHAAVPACCTRKSEPGDATVQIVRTQPEEGDKTVKDAYFQATDQAALASGYIYLENQYFQYAEWAERLLKTRKQVVEKWNAVCGASGKSARDLPILHVFIVIPAPERKSMIPRTYDTLAVLGQQEAMSGQVELIKQANAGPAQTVLGGIGQRTTITPKLPEVVRDANLISKLSGEQLETEYGLKICTAMLNACEQVDGMWCYREIYIHSKLLLIDDVFLTLGSTNLNQRSMAVDSEINIAAVSENKTSDLRKRIWMQLSGSNKISESQGSYEEIFQAFLFWKILLRSNDVNMKKNNFINGLIISFSDNRSSTMRLG